MPLFFQGVQGYSATGSGAFLTPVMLGMVVGAVVSGQLLSRTGARYRLQAVLSTAAMTTGMYLLSTMDQETGFLLAVAYIVLMGLGMGGTLSTLGVAGAELGCRSGWSAFRRPRCTSTAWSAARRVWRCWAAC